jgi:hypothetical protein
MSDDPLGDLFARLRGAAEPLAEESDAADEAEATDVADDSAADRDRAVVADGESPGNEPAVPIVEPAPGEPPPPSSADLEYAVVAVDLIESEPVEPEPHWPLFAVAESATLDDAGLRRRRDAAIETALGVLAPRVKRLLQDEQNELLDRIRRQRGKGAPVDAFPTEAEQLDSWCDAFTTAIDGLYAAGRTMGGGRTRPAPGGLTRQLVGLLVGPLRERVAASLVDAGRDAHDGSPEAQRTIASAIGARYREYRGQELDAALRDLSSWAFARGVYDATPDGVTLRWVPAEHEQCPDADDNALEPTCKGRPFPTGQSCPPAHAGCRCLVVPATS